MKRSLLFLGSGGSMGVPIIGCDCQVCTSSISKNKRTRPSVLLKFGDKNYLIDVGPDFHAQALKHKVNHLDGVMITHAHYDHIAGLDELRIYHFRQKKPTPCLLSKETLQELKVRYHYLFSPGKNEMHSANFDFQTLPDDNGSVTFGDLRLKYISYTQSGMKVNGFRCNNLSYVTDIHEYSEKIFNLLKGTSTLVVSALRWEQSPVHFSLDEAIDFANKIGAKQTYFTHITHDIDYETTSKKLPACMALSYDGLEIEV